MVNVTVYVMVNVMMMMMMMMMMLATMLNQAYLVRLQVPSTNHKPQVQEPTSPQPNTQSAEVLNAKSLVWESEALCKGRSRYHASPQFNGFRTFLLRL